MRQTDTELRLNVVDSQSRGNRRRETTIFYSKKVDGFYVYYWYLVVSAVRSILTFMAIAMSLSATLGMKFPILAFGVLDTLKTVQWRILEDTGAYI